MEFALSTAWNASRHGNGRSLIFEIKKIGFRRVELSFNLTPLMVRQISDLVKLKQILVVSLHNFCPIPSKIKREEALPDYFSLSSLDEDERKKAVENTKRTIRTAGQLNARAVVLHCGRVEVRDRTRELIALLSQGGRKSKAYFRLKNSAILERQAKQQPYFENALRSLEVLNKLARKYAIMLGVETRFYYCEIPCLGEIDGILNRFKGSNILYWHDLGHAQIMEILGFAKHKDFLSAYSEKMLGIHLHDLIGCQDHHAPGEGQLNFQTLKPYLNLKRTIPVIEAHKQASQNQVKKAKRFLEEIFDE